MGAVGHKQVGVLREVDLKDRLGDLEGDLAAHHDARADEALDRAEGEAAPARRALPQVQIKMAVISIYAAKSERVGVA